MSLLFSTGLMKWRLCIAIAEPQQSYHPAAKKNRNRRRNRHRMMCRFGHSRGSATQRNQSHHSRDADQVGEGFS